MHEEEPHVHITGPDGNYLPSPEVGDVHGWTVLYQTIACGTHTHRVLGWVGDMPSALKLACVTAALWHPVIRCTPTPAPDKDVSPERIGVISDMPEELAARVHAGEVFNIRELIEAGATALSLVDDVMPEPVMIAARVIEHLDAKNIDVVALLSDVGEHNGRAALIAAGGEPMVRAILKEFPSPDLSAGTGH